MSSSTSSISHSEFGKLPTGEVVTQYELKNSTGMEVSVIDYGCATTKLIVPDKNGDKKDVVLGFDKLEHYLDTTINPYYGSVVGRYANRIGGGKITIDGKEHKLSVNETGNGGDTTLHGGFKGFDKKLWKMTTFSDECPEVIQLTLEYTSPDGEEGFPGNLHCVIDHILRKKENSLKIRYRATTDAKTVVNLSNHSYFNLEGHQHGSILDHEFEIFMDSYIPVATTFIPTGEVRAVKDTPFDFLTKPKRVGQDIDDHSDEQIKTGPGYDHSYYAPTKQRGDMTHCSRHSAPVSGITMEVSTTLPGAQLYTGNWIPEASNKGKEGANYGKRSGFALETQNVPDAMHHDHFPNCILSPGETYDESTVFKFTTREA